MTPGLASFLTADLIQDLVFARPDSVPCLSPHVVSNYEHWYGLNIGLVPDVLPYLAQEYLPEVVITRFSVDCQTWAQN